MHFSALVSSAEKVAIFSTGEIWGFRDTTDRPSSEARMIFRHRTLHPGGLNVDFHTKSARAVNVAMFVCFVFYLNATKHIFSFFQSIES